MKKNLATVIFCLAAINFSYAKKAPVWFANLNQAFPPAEYIAETGMGPTKDSAKSNAASYLARYFESNVDTSTVNSLHAVSHNDNLDKTEETDIQTVISTNISLFSVEFTSAYYVKKEKTYYVAAYINRKNATEIFKPKIEIPASNFNGFYETALKQNDPLLKAVTLSKALESAREFEDAYSFLLMLNLQEAAKYKSTHKAITGLTAEIQNLFLNCPTAILCNDTEILSSAKNVLSSFGIRIVPEKDALYRAKILLNFNEQIYETGTFYVTDVDVEFVKNNSTVLAINAQTERVGAKNRDVAKRRAVSAAKELLTLELNKQFGAP